MPTYISSRDLKDVFPNLDEFDTKKPVYGWVVDSGSRYVAHDSGLVTQLFVDRKDLGSVQSSKSAVDAKRMAMINNNGTHQLTYIDNSDGYLKQIADVW